MINFVIEGAFHDSTHSVQSYLCDQWQVGSGNVEELFNPSTEEMIATTCTTGLDFDAAFDYARTVGGNCIAYDDLC